MANENIKKFLDQDGVSLLWSKVVENITAEADRAKAAEKVNADAAAAAQKTADDLAALVGNIPTDENGDAIAATVIAYVDQKTEGIATDAALAELQGKVKTIEDDYLQADDIADMATKTETAATYETIANADLVRGRVAELEAHKNDYQAYADQAEADAKAYADEVKRSILTGDTQEELKDTYDTLIEIQNWIEGAGVNATELTEAIAGESARAQEAESALSERLDVLDNEIDNLNWSDLGEKTVTEAETVFSSMVERGGTYSGLPNTTLSIGDNCQITTFQGARVIGFVPGTYNVYVDENYSLTTDDGYTTINYNNVNNTYTIQTAFVEPFNLEIVKLPKTEIVEIDEKYIATTVAKIEALENKVDNKQIEEYFEGTEPEWVLLKENPYVDSMGYMPEVSVTYPVNLKFMAYDRDNNLIAEQVITEADGVFVDTEDGPAFSYTGTEDSIIAFISPYDEYGDNYNKNLWVKINYNIEWYSMNVYQGQGEKTVIVKTLNEKYIDSTIARVADMTTALAGKETAGAAATAEANAKSYADGLASNYDAAGSASAAEAAAKSYADGLASNYDEAGAAAGALTSANAYTDSAIANIQVLSNEDILDIIDPDWRDESPEPTLPEV